jgi:murein DD-endopeptidase MepM/ murein hydrolase activator NlpD
LKPVFAAILAVGMAWSGACARPEPPPVRVGRDVRLAPDIKRIEAIVPPRATLDSLLRGHDLSSDLVHAAVQSARAVFNPRQLRANRPYRLVLSFDGFLREFEYEIDADRFLRIFAREGATPDGLTAEVLPFVKQRETVAITGVIDAEHASLISAIDETGEGIQLAMSLAEIFGGQIDFETDLQQGDTFEVLFEKTTREGQFAGYGPILGATFDNAGRRHQAFRWVNPDTGRAGYYDEEGRSLKRLLLASPLKFEPRITSRFSRRRLHPVHRTVRAHLGVDYGAPHGAAVVAVASGTVVSAGWAGAGGKQIRIRHAGGLESYYLHLSSFAKGIRAGARVDQGQFIGRVGATGTATGPHLDFRLRKRNAFVDPVAERRRQPPGEPIPAIHLAAFRTAREDLAGQIATALAAEPQRRPDAVRAGQ